MTAFADSAAPASQPRFPSLAAQLDGPLGTFLQHRILPGWLPSRRWFRSKTHPVRSVELEAVFACGQDAVFAVARVSFAEGPVERYALPLALADLSHESELPEAAVLGPVATPAGLRLLIDGCWSPDFRAEFYHLLARHHDTSATGGALRGRPVSSAALGADSDGEVGHKVNSPKRTIADQTTSQGHAPSSRVLNAEQSNTSLVYDGDGGSPLFVKLYRRLEVGVHPEPEMLRFLSEHTRFRHAPGFRSSLEWVTADGHACTAALAQEFVPKATDAWTFVLSGLRATSADPSASITPVLGIAALMGRRVAELHVAVTSHPDLPAFAPEPFTMADADAARTRAHASLTAGARAAANAALNAALPKLEALLDAAVQAVDSGETGSKIRTHGDLHLGQILVREDPQERNLSILDFEGEPGRPLAAARVKQSPLRDVAGVLRSFHYAAHAAVLLRDAADETAPRDAKAIADATYDPEGVSAALCAAFLETYWSVAETGKPDLLPATARTRRALLDLFVLEKAAYELQYECDNRPDWVLIPLRGLLRLAAT